MITWKFHNIMTMNLHNYVNTEKSPTILDILLSSTGSSKLHDNFELEVKKTSIIKARQFTNTV